MNCQSGLTKIYIEDVLAKSEASIPTYKKKIEDIAEKIVETPGFYTFVNPFNFKFFGSKEYLNILQNANGVFVDGMLLVRFLKKSHRINVSRLSFDGNSIAPHIFNWAIFKNKKIFLLGGEKGVAESSAKLLNKKLKTEIVIGHESGFFKSIDEVINKISLLGSDIVVVGMGAPLQDNVSLAISERLPSITVITCGGYLDQLLVADELQYYPSLISRLNLRAFYRLYKEPKKMFIRYFVDYGYFYSEVFNRTWKKIIKSV